MKRGGGTPGSRNSVKRARYKQSARKMQQDGAVQIKLTEGHQGFLVICDGGMEIRAGKEGSVILDELVGNAVAAAPAPARQEQEGTGDQQEAGNAPVPAPASVASALEQELAELRDVTGAGGSGGDAAAQRRHVFWHETGCKGTRFFQLKAKGYRLDPWEILRPFFQRITQEHSAPCRFISRLVPVQRTCFADHETILRLLKPMIEAVFPADAATPLSFAIRYQARMHGKVSRDDLIAAIAAMVPAPHSVNLTQPDREITVEIFKGVACLAITDCVPGVKRFSLRSKGVDAEAARQATQAGTRAPATGGGHGAASAAAAASAGAGDAPAAMPGVAEPTVPEMTECCEPGC